MTLAKTPNPHIMFLSAILALFIATLTFGERSATLQVAINEETQKLYIFDSEMHRVDYWGAAGYCAKFGGVPFKIKSPDEARWVQANMKLDASDQFWTSISPYTPDTRYNTYPSNYTDGTSFTWPRDMALWTDKKYNEKICFAMLIELNPNGRDRWTNTFTKLIEAECSEDWFVLCELGWDKRDDLVKLKDTTEKLVKANFDVELCKNETSGDEVRIIEERFAKIAQDKKDLEEKSNSVQTLQKELDDLKKSNDELQARVDG